MAKAWALKAADEIAGKLWAGNATALAHYREHYGEIIERHAAPVIARAMVNAVIAGGGGADGGELGIAVDRLADLERHYRVLAVFAKCEVRRIVPVRDRIDPNLAARFYSEADPPAGSTPNWETCGVHYQCAVCKAKAAAAVAGVT